jgi:enoyl-CoA hydratase
MTYTNLLTETRESVALITINRPQALNALNSELLTELAAAIATFGTDPQIGAIVLTGSPKAFAAGADIKQMAQATPVEMMNNGISQLLDAVRNSAKPVIAAVSGYCLGGGFELALACDILLAAENAKFGLPEVTIGVIPGGGGTQRVARTVGKSLAMEMILNNRQLTAAEALQVGLTSRVLPNETYLEEALALAAEIASRAPVAVRLAREAIHAAYESGLTQGIEDERRLFYLAFSTDDQKEGMGAFLEKRKPQWTGK